MVGFHFHVMASQSIHSTIPPAPQLEYHMLAVVTHSFQRERKEKPTLWLDNNVTGKVIIMVEIIGELDD